MRRVNQVCRHFAGFAAGVQSGLYRTAYMLCGDAEGARDLTQETLTRLFRTRPLADRQGDSDTDTCGMRTLLQVFFDDGCRGLPRSQACRPDAKPERANPELLELRTALMAGLARLPARRRAVLVLRCFEGLSIEETADLVGCGVPDVERQTHRGLAALQDLLSPDCRGSGGPDQQDSSNVSNASNSETSLRLQCAAAADGITLTEDLIPFVSGSHVTEG